MKKHYVGATYPVTQETINHLIKQLEEKHSKVSFEYANTHENKWEIECHIKAVDSQMAIYDALNKIRSRLKYNKTSKAERDFLQTLRSVLLEVYLEE
jgi:hypothetical protein